MAKSNAEFAAEIKEKAATWGAVRRLDPMLQLKTAMRNKNLKNVDIAERLCVSEANISRILKGRGNVTLDTLYMLADAVETELFISIGDANTVVAGNGGETHGGDGELLTVGAEGSGGTDGIEFFQSPDNVIRLVPRWKQAERHRVHQEMGDTENEARVAFG